MTMDKKTNGQVPLDEQRISLVIYSLGWKNKGNLCCGVEKETACTLSNMHKQENYYKRQWSKKAIKYWQVLHTCSGGL